MAPPFNRLGSPSASGVAPITPPDTFEELGGKKSCLYCKQKFAHLAELSQHKKDRLMKEFAEGGAENVLHNFCYICNKDFVARDAVEAHWTQYHAKSQSINCPGCNAHFLLLSAFVKHIELDLCPKFSQQNVASRAEANLNFTRQLAVLDPDIAHRHKDFGSFLGGGTETLERLGNSDVPNDPWTQPVDPDAWNDTHKLVSEPKDFSKQRPHNLAGNNTRRSAGLENTNPWVSDKPLLPNAPHAQQPSSDQLQGLERFQPDQRALMKLSRSEIMDSDNPDSKGWDARRYLDPYLRKYKCPRSRCTKSFKNGAALKAHLKSLAHVSDKKFTCPSCLNDFQSLHSLASHVESAAKKCSIRDSDFFGIFIGQLTWNLIEVAGEHGEDGTTKYEIAKKAHEDYGNVEPSQSMPTLGHRPIPGCQPVTAGAFDEQQSQIRKQEQHQASAVPSTLLTEAAPAQQHHQQREQWKQSNEVNDPRTTPLDTDALSNLEKQRAREIGLDSPHMKNSGFEGENGWAQCTVSWGEPSIGWGEKNQGWALQDSSNLQNGNGWEQQNHNWAQQDNVWDQGSNEWSQRNQLWTQSNQASIKAQQDDHNNNVWLQQDI